MNIKTPKHIAIILDGNKRWASKNNLSILEGYQKGLEKIKIITQLNLEKKIPYLTLFTLSSENLLRNTINNIFKIIFDHFEQFLHEIIDKNKIKIRIIGRRNNLPKKIVNIINKCEKLTINNKELTLNLAFNYGFKNEISDVIQKIIKSKKLINPNNLSEINDLFYLGDIPDPDILIRTGGHKRLSNFILYNLSYTEMFFVDTLWPDFSILEFNQIISEYYKIKKNHGL